MQPAPQARPILILDSKATLSSMSCGSNGPGVSTHNDSDEAFGHRVDAAFCGVLTDGRSSTPFRGRR